jgi:hypothetical protein
MIVLALALLILVLVFSVAIVVSNPDVYQLSLFRVLVPVTSAGVSFTGFGAALVTITALLLLRTGIRRARENRRRLRSADRTELDSSATTTRGRSSADRATDPDTDRSADPDSTQRGELGDGADAGEPTGSTARANRSDESASSLDLEPGEDSTTSPVESRRTSDSPDRDEPRA